MAIALIIALLIHVAGLAHPYKHSNGKIATKVRAGAAIASWLLTSALLVLVQQALHEQDWSKIKFGADSAGVQAIVLVTTPDKSACYAAAPQGEPDHK